MVVLQRSHALGLKDVVKETKGVLAFKEIVFEKSAIQNHLHHGIVVSRGNETINGGVDLCTTAKQQLDELADVADEVLSHIAYHFDVVVSLHGGGVSDGKLQQGVDVVGDALQPGVV